MTVEQVYERFIIKINKNAQTDNIQSDRGRFVELYNENCDKWLEWTLEKRNEDDVRYAQPLLIPLKKIEPSVTEKTIQKFKLPSDYFDLVVVSAMADSDCCKGEKIDLYEAKGENIDFYLQDQFNKPSFDFRESTYYLASNEVVVFIDDFKITNINLTYYRYPVKIALKNPEDPESGFQDGIEFLLDDKVIDRIVSMCATDFDLNNDNQKYQAQKQGVSTKF